MKNVVLAGKTKKSVSIFFPHSKTKLNYKEINQNAQKRVVPQSRRASPSSTRHQLSLDSYFYFLQLALDLHPASIIIIFDIVYVKSTSIIPRVLRLPNETSHERIDRKSVV